MTLMQTSAGFQPRTDNGGTMPLPTPHAGEHLNDFVGRCLLDPATQGIAGDDALPAHARRLAACIRAFDGGKVPPKDRKAADEGGADAIGMKAMRDVTIGDEAKGEVSAVISTFDEVDNDAEVIPTGAIPDGTKVTVSSYNHDTIMGHMLGTGVPDAPPVGKGVIRTMGNKAVAQINYFMETQRGREAFNTVKAMGPDQAWSFAYRKLQVDKPTAEWAAKGAKRVLTKLGPLLDGAMECSPVKMPGGVGTGTLSAKEATIEAKDSAPEPIPADITEWIPSFYAERAAKTAYAAGVKKFRIPNQPAMRWFRGPNKRVTGLHFPDRNEIWISTGLDAKTTAIVVGHELFHALQAQRNAPEPGHGFEAQAEAFAIDLVRDLEREGLLE